MIERILVWLECRLSDLWALHSALERRKRHHTTIDEITKGETGDFILDVTEQTTYVVRRPDNSVHIPRQRSREKMN